MDQITAQQQGLLYLNTSVVLFSIIFGSNMHFICCLSTGNTPSTAGDNFALVFARKAPRRAETIKLHMQLHDLFSHYILGLAVMAH